MFLHFTGLPFTILDTCQLGAIGDTCQAIASKEVKEKVALSVHYGRAKSYSAFLDPRPVVRSRAEDQENNGRVERCGETLR